MFLSSRLELVSQLKNVPFSYSICGHPKDQPQDMGRREVIKYFTKTA
jgi:hypothetical protein